MKNFKKVKISECQKSNMYNREKGIGDWHFDIFPVRKIFFKYSKNRQVNIILENILIVIKKTYI